MRAYGKWFCQVLRTFYNKILLKIGKCWKYGRFCLGQTYTLLLIRSLTPSAASSTNSNLSHGYLLCLGSPGNLDSFDIGQDWRRIFKDEFKAKLSPQNTPLRTFFCVTHQEVTCVKKVISFSQRLIGSPWFYLASRHFLIWGKLINCT